MGSVATVEKGRHTGKVDSSRLLEMEQAFLANGGEFKTFRIDELFNKKTMKGFPKSAENLQENSEGFHIFGQNIKYQHPQKVLLDEKYLHTVNPEKPILGYTSSVGEIGIIAESFYRSGDNGAFQGLFPKFEKYNKKHILYLLTVLQKHFINFNYGTGMADILQLPIQVPYQNNQIAFDFMENFVYELQASRLRELKIYLQVTGLSDYVLIDEEKMALSQFDELLSESGGVKRNEISELYWCEYNLATLFGKATRGKRLKSADRVSGDLPFVTAGETDTGISAFIGNQVEVFNANTVTIDMFGSAKYRNYAYGADDHIAVVHCDKLAPNAAVFLTAAIHKVANAGQFSYARNFYAKDADELNISLPSKSGKPDYDFMATLAKAVKK